MHGIGARGTGVTACLASGAARDGFDGVAGQELTQRADQVGRDRGDIPDEDAWRHRRLHLAGHGAQVTGRGARRESTC